MNKKGFTLTELIIVVAIIGILAMIAVPAYIGQLRSAARTEAYTNLQTLRLLQEKFFAENGEYAPDTATANSTSTTTLLYGIFDGTTYDTSTTNARDIDSFLPGFRPGLAGSLSFNYEIEFTVTGAGATARTSSFRARAIGKAGTRVVGDSFTIDNNNNRNF